MCGIKTCHTEGNVCGGKWLFASIWNGYLLSYLRGVVNREGIQFLPGILRKRSEWSWREFSGFGEV